MFFIGIFLVLLFILLHQKNRKRLFDNPPVTKHYSISFLVPAYNEEKSLEQTVKALYEIEYPKGRKEIIIVNDGSMDGTAKIARKLCKNYLGVRLLDKKNSGKADSLNQAIQMAKGELVAVVDADSYPKSDALLKMVGHFDDKNVGAVTSRVLVKNKNNWLSKFQVMDYSIIAWTRKLLDFVDSVYVTNGPLSIYRKNLIKKIGGFDPKNLTEDIEITWHILSLGYKTRMSYSAIVYTNVPEALDTWIKQRVRWNLGGLQTLKKYWKSMLGSGSFGYFVIPYVAGSFILALIGFLLFSRYIWARLSLFFYSLFYISDGYKFFRYIDIDFPITFLLFLGLTFFLLALFHYKLGFKNSETGNKSILKIILYTFVYRPLYVVPLILALYKIAIGDIRWYTK